MTVTHSTGSDTVNSLTVNDNLNATFTLSGGSLSLTNASVSGSTDTFNLSGGTLMGTGTLTVGGAATWSDGTMTGPGTTTIAGTGSLVLSTTGLKDLTQRTLNTAGPTTLSGGRIRTGSGAILNNTNTWDDQVDSQISNDFGGAASTFTNAGTFRKSGATATTAISITFTNSGTVDVQSGTLNLSGSLSNLSGTTLTGGTYLVTGTLQLPGASASIVTNAANIVLNGTGAAAIINQSSGSALATFATNDGSFTVQNGRNFSTADNFTNNGTLGVGAGSAFTINGSLTNFSGGTLTGGTYLIGGTFQFNNAAITTNAATIVLDGTAATIVDQTAADALAGFATNAATGSFTIQNGRNVSSSGTFTNAGNLTVGNGSTFTQTAAYNQTGTLNILAGGTASLQDGTDSGTLSDAGTLTVTANSGFTESGAYSQTGTLMVQAGGTLTLSGSFSNYSAGTLTDGIYQLAGTFQFANAAITTNAATILLDGTSSRIIDLADNNALTNLASNADAGSLTIQNGRNLTTSGAFSNAGSVVIGSGSTFTAGGNYSQTAGTTTVSGGTLAASSLVDIQAGTLAGTGTINANVQNAGLLTIGDSATVGVLTINGNYIQTSAGTLAVKVGGFTVAGSDFDQLVLTAGHQATLDGTLNVTLVHGYTPTTGDSVKVMTFDSATGTFAALSGDGSLFTTNYDATDVTLVAN